jgi:hypothetical protein
LTFPTTHAKPLPVLVPRVRCGKGIKILNHKGGWTKRKWWVLSPGAERTLVREHRSAESRHLQQGQAALGSKFEGNTVRITHQGPKPWLPPQL